MNWTKKAPIAITVTDKEGKIIEANSKAAEVFKRFGDFIGKNLKDCHNEKSKEKIKDMFEKKYINAYTIEKKGVKNLYINFHGTTEKNSPVMLNYPLNFHQTCLIS